MYIEILVLIHLYHCTSCGSYWSGGSRLQLNVWTDDQCTGPVSLCHPGLVTGDSVVSEESREWSEGQQTAGTAGAFDGCVPPTTSMLFKREH